jgi:hypothetical protein
MDECARARAAEDTYIPAAPGGPWWGCVSSAALALGLFLLSTGSTNLDARADTFPRKLRQANVISFGRASKLRSLACWHRYKTGLCIVIYSPGWNLVPRLRSYLEFDDPVTRRRSLAARAV